MGAIACKYCGWVGGVNLHRDRQVTRDSQANLISMITLFIFRQAQVRLVREGKQVALQWLLAAAACYLAG